MKPDHEAVGLHGAMPQNLARYSDSIWAIAFSSDGLPGGSGKNKQQSWDVQTGRCLKLLKGHGVGCDQLPLPR